MTTKAKTYDWFDSQQFERVKKVVNAIVETIDKNGGQWQSEWLNNFSLDYYNKIWKECFEDVCNEMGFEKVEHSAIGVNTYLAVSDGEALIARVEVKKRLLPIEKSFKEMLRPGTLSIISRKISKRFSEVIEIKDGKPYLPDDYEQRLETICTRTIPEEWRGLCDLLRDNESVFAELVEQLKQHRRQPTGWMNCFKDGKFSLESYGKMIGLI